jgi:hypothetical protein
MTQEGTGFISLKRQLELTRFERAIAIAESLAEKRALLTTLELARVNLALMGRDLSDSGPEPWRDEPVTITLPGGRTETLSLMKDPKLNTREILHAATELAETGHPIPAAVHAYVELVLLHGFKDANRRTAVAAAHYFLERYHVPVSGRAIHELGLGDLRQPGVRQLLQETIEQMARFGGRT